MSSRLRKFPEETIPVCRVAHYILSSFDDTLSGSWHPPSAPMIATAPSASLQQPAESAYFLAVNRNKKSITVNFKTPEGLEILRKLVKKSDVLVENFVSGKLASMGLGWEDCQKINEKLIYASITGMSIYQSRFLVTHHLVGR